MHNFWCDLVLYLNQARHSAFHNERLKWDHLTKYFNIWCRSSQLFMRFWTVCNLVIFSKINFFKKFQNLQKSKVLPTYLVRCHLKAHETLSPTVLNIKKDSDTWCFFTSENVYYGQQTLVPDSGTRLNCSNKLSIPLNGSTPNQKH